MLTCFCITKQKRFVWLKGLNNLFSGCFDIQPEFHDSLIIMLNDLMPKTATQTLVLHYSPHDRASMCFFLCRTSTMLTEMVVEKQRLLSISLSLYIYTLYMPPWFELVFAVGFTDKLFTVLLFKSLCKWMSKPQNIQKKEHKRLIEYQILIRTSE